MFQLLEIVPVVDVDKLQVFLQKLLQWGVDTGTRIAAALLIYIIGRFLTRFINRFVARLLERRKVDASIQSFVKSLVNILLTVLVIIAVISKLGVETTSFAALLASAGVAVGMALSGNLQNFAGGLVVLLFRPYKVGDYIESQGVAGTVREIQIFHTIIVTVDNKLVYIPNGSLSNSSIINYSREGTRRVDWTFNVEYGEDFKKVEQTLKDIIKADKRILQEPEPFIALSALGDSSVDILVRVWVSSADYWGVYFDMNKVVYEEFTKRGISFPFPQLTVHQG